MRTAIRKLPYTIGKGLVVDAVQKKDIAEAFMLATKAFCNDEPLSIFCKISQSTFYDPLIKLYATASDVLIPVGIKDEQSTFVAALNSMPFSLSPTTYAPHFGPYIQALVREAEDSYRHYYHMNKYEGKVLSMITAAVDSRMRGRNLAMHLNYATGILGKSFGYSRVETVTTNKFSYELLTKMGMKVVKQIPYEEWTYFGEKGAEQPFKGINEVYTKQVNKGMKGREPITNAAQYYSVLDIAIDDMISGCEKILI
jgi:hypothetical protein